MRPTSKKKQLKFLFREVSNKYFFNKRTRKKIFIRSKTLWLFLFKGSVNIDLKLKLLTNFKSLVFNAYFDENQRVFVLDNDLFFIVKNKENSDSLKIMKISTFLKGEE